MPPIAAGSLITVREENERWKRAFTEAGLDLPLVWSPHPADLELENQQLQSLWTWVKAYQVCPDRETLIRRGFLFPPIDSDIDPASDWLRFERWLRGEPLKWNYVLDHGVLPDVDELSDQELTHLLELVRHVLGQHGVCVDVAPAVPDRLVYAYLQDELVWIWFDICAPGTWCHLGCAGDCGSCYQQPWCEVAREVACLESGAR